MQKRPAIVGIGTMLLLLPGALFARTNCDLQPKPALSCPPGYDVMCIPTGGDHWGCGKDSGAMINEVPPMQQQQGTVAAPAAQAVQEPQPAPQADAPSTTTAPASEPAPSVTEAAAPPSVEPIGEAAPQVADDTGSPVVPADAGPTTGKPSTWYILSYGILVLALIAFGSWIRRLLEGLRKGGDTKPEEKKGGDTKAEEKKPCARCGGTGTIEQEYEERVKCVHCGGSGTDPCHHCSGTGKMSMPNPAQSELELEGWPPCDFCGGSGKKTLGAGRDWGEANGAMAGGFACCFCGGKKTETIKKKRTVPCPDCKK